MPEIVVNKIPINFPFTPYDVQEKYMEKVMECLNKGQNGVLESPTGTGKTLCLLCATLGWLESMNKKVSLEEDISAPSLLGTGTTNRNKTGLKIIYASRTHTQIAQAINELKRTQYNHMKSAVLGSRVQLCIHEYVLREITSDDKNNLCQRLRLGAEVENPETQGKEKGCCKLKERVEECKDNPAFVDSGVLDIEDLVKAGQALECCPYYIAHSLKKQADIIFMPYNYILDPVIRRTLKIGLSHAIVILDEAHNIEKVLEESESCELSSSAVAHCIQEIAAAERLILLEEQEDKESIALKYVSSFTEDDFKNLKDKLLKLERVIHDIKILGKKSGKFFIELFINSDITKDNKHCVVHILENLAKFFDLRRKSIKGQAACLKKIANIIHLVFTQEDSDNSCYKVFVEDEKDHGKKKKAQDLQELNPKKGRTIHYWCFSASVGMRRMMREGVHSVIMTSGTLSPIDALISELGVPFPVQLENLHVIKKDQVYVSVVKSGPDNQPLNSKFENRENELYIASLGQTVANFARMVPGGLLVFFPSYRILTKCQEQWQKDSALWSKISNNKAVFVESQHDKRNFDRNIEGYYDQIKSDDNKGAVFLAVCKGKVSEGLDFSDNKGRAVMITGLPYAPCKEPKVLLKQEYLDESMKRKNGEGLGGKRWYQLEATRAVNQAIGRVIRHCNDYGAILLCDTRFADERICQELSKWLRAFVLKNNFQKSFQGLVGFFKQQKINEMTPSKLMTQLNLDNPKTPEEYCSCAEDVNVPSSPMCEKRPRMDVTCPKHNSLAKRKLPLVMQEAKMKTFGLSELFDNEQQKAHFQVVQICLTKADYQTLEDAFDMYKVDNNFKCFFKAISNIFLNKHDIEHLMGGFEACLSEDHREKFTKMCKLLLN